jgi:FkbM family methyltransferase
VRNYWHIVRNQKRPLRFVLSRLLMRTRLSLLFFIERPGFKLRFYPTYVSARLWVESEYRGDFDEELFLRRYLRHGDTVIDVGANIGFTSLVAAAEVGETGTVVAIEPHPRMFSYLRGNVSLNPRTNVLLFDVAVGEQKTEIYLTDQTDECVNFVTTQNAKLRVDMVRLDELPIGNAKIALLKLDVEGYELFALRGSTKILKNVECIYFESYEDNFVRYDYTCGDVLTFLSQRGFHTLKEFGEAGFVPIDTRHNSRECENLIAVRNVSQLLDRTGIPINASRSRGL